MPNQSEKKEKKNAPVLSSQKVPVKISNRPNQPRISSSGHDSKLEEKHSEKLMEKVVEKKEKKEKKKGDKKNVEKEFKIPHKAILVGEDNSNANVDDGGQWTQVVNMKKKSKTQEGRKRL